MSNLPNFVFIIADTLRADECYADHTDTPTIDRLSANGLTFKQAYSVGAETSVSHGALFSGQYPSETGIVGKTQLPGVPLLAEYLRDHGYDTYGIAGPGRMSSKWGYDRGFNEYFEAYTNDKPPYLSSRFVRTILSDSILREPLLRDAIRMSVRGPDSHTHFKFNLLAKVTNQCLDTPFFTLLNTTIVHNPYHPPKPFKKESTPSLNRPRWEILKLFGADEELQRDDLRLNRISNAQTNDGIARYLSNPDYLDEQELTILRSWYRACLEYFDRQLGNFLSTLRSRGQLENTIVVFLSDHGEYFGEHGLIAHGNFLHEEVTHVPLVMSGPGIDPGVRTDLVSLVDLFDTVCDIASIPRPKETSGISILTDPPRNEVYSEYGLLPDDKTGHRKYMSDRKAERFQRGLKSIRTDEYTYFFDSNNNGTLYDRSTGQEVDDPDGAVKADLHDRLINKLGSEFKSAYRDDDDDIDPGLKENLRKLGYIEQDK